MALTIVSCIIYTHSCTCKEYQYEIPFPYAVFTF